ncbi:WYL domain-containing protein [Salimicrobium jeotgali]|uniref:Transcriptional regulator n=1 Tax=Salimicrobium jeotgali TaxID=1230341 RepID=K2H7I3_9BACI|nr:WYL domain-containing protein [Salimicrobium jeotgali]AKG04933.1 WYL domain-containing protein [Salimicrobium jeotgali]EKE31610.1 transcriptional regulator [Salimicrobium jeotgali]MBM7696431.1 putative DNA-binding transcriptional regulator YafY [Salimicrobium jeotgali]
MELNNNTRLLTLLRILFEETDENNELSITEMSSKLQEFFGVDREFDSRTLKSDMNVLEEIGYEIIKNRGKFGKVYYSFQDRLFETYQLRLLNDAILSARFINGEEKKKLIKKLGKLTSRHIAATLPDPLIFSQMTANDYDQVKINIDHVHRAISEQRVVCFKYGKYNMNKTFEYHRNGDEYEVKPYALIWQNDFYYLIGWFRKTEEMRHYRLDRIRNIRIAEETFEKGDFDVQEYVNQSFHMFSGENMKVEIKFHQSLLNVVLDRFGLEVSVKQVDEEYFLLSTEGKMSTGLVTWVLQWGHKARVVSPRTLKQEVEKEIEKMRRLYEE